MEHRAPHKAGFVFNYREMHGKNDKPRMCPRRYCNLTIAPFAMPLGVSPINLKQVPLGGVGLVFGVLEAQVLEGVAGGGASPGCPVQKA